MKKAVSSSGPSDFGRTVAIPFRVALMEETWRRLMF